MFDGKAIQAARRAAGLKGKELASRVGVTNVTISRIENGRQGPSRNLMERIAAELRVKLEAFYGEEARRGGTMGGPELSREEREILDCYRRLDEIGRAKVWAFVMGLASVAPTEGQTAEASAAKPQAAGLR